MLESLLGSICKEKVLIFILCREEGYAREIAKFYEIPLTPVINQLKKLESSSIIFARSQGRTKVYKFNPRYQFLPELKKLLEKAVSFYPQELQQELLYNRRRPRRSNKAL